MAVVRNLMVRAGADFSGMRREMQRGTRTMQDFQRNVSRSMKGITAVLATLGIGAAIKNATKEAMNFEASLQQIDRTLGSSAQSFKDWAKDSAGSFNLAKTDAIKYGAVFSNLISGFSSGTAETSQRTQDLLKASAVVASATGRTMTDTLDRIRSGLLGNTESIEDLGINVNVAMIQSTEAFKKFANGKSWLQLDFQTQQQIRLFAILEQSASKYGTELAKNTNTAQGAFVKNLKDAQLALGQAFLPIYNVILPALTRLAASLASVLNIVAQFTQALFGTGKTDDQTKATTDQAGAVSSLGDAYETAGKQAKGSIASFDEVNLVGGSTGAAGIDVGSALNNSTTLDPSNGLNEIGDKTVEISKKVRDAAEEVRKTYQKIKEAVLEVWDTMRPFSEWLANQYAVNWGIVGDVVSWVWKNVTIPIGKAEVWLWKEVLVPFGNFLGGLYTAIWGGIGSAMMWVWKSVLVPIGNAFKWLWNEVLVPFGSWLSDGFVKDWDDLGNGGSNIWKKVFVPFGEFMAGFWNDTLVPFGNFLKDVFVGAWDAVNSAASSVWKDVFVPFGNLISNIWNEGLKPFGNWLKDVFTKAWEAVGKSAGGLMTDLKSLMSFLKGAFTIDWGNVWNGLKTTFSNVFDNLYGIVKTPLNHIIDAINKIIDGLNSISIDIPKVSIPGIGDIGGGSIGIPHINPIKHLAKGGLAFGPTLAMVGDNRGAANNPEVIAPLSELESIMSESGNDGELVSVMRSVLQAIKENRTVQAVIARDAVGQAAVGYINDETRRGKNPLPAL